MRKVVLLPLALMALLLAPAASAKLPFFGLDVHPLRPRIGEPITLTMTCYDDIDHTRPWSSCMGAGSRMAWVHPLDDEGTLARDDWIEIVGRATSSGATRGRITLQEPGAYDVLPLWRTWSAEARYGFPGTIRVEVMDGTRITPLALGAFGVVGICLAVAAWWRRTREIGITL
jgi:hypothetical protein